MARDRNHSRNSFKSGPKSGKSHGSDRGFDRKPDRRPSGGGGPRIGLYGIHAVQEAWLNPDRNINALYITDQALPSFEAVLERARAAGLTRPNPTVVEKEQIDRSTPPGAVHQGVGIDTPPLPEAFIQDLLIRTKDKKRALIVVLDQVTDPHNIGAILRSACVFGADGMIVQSRNAPDLNALIAKTACGGVEHVPVAYETNLSRALETLKEHGFFAIGLDERGTQTPSEIPVFEKAVLVLGAEGPGLRPLVRDTCDLLVRLPTFGPISSLNVSNAAAVALYAMTAR